MIRHGDHCDGKVAVLEGLKGSEKLVSVGQNELYRGVHVVIDESVAQ